jgi:hypothetical protein
VKVPYWLHWVGIAALVAGSTAFVSRIDPKPGKNLALGARVTTSINDGTLESDKGAIDGDIWNVGFRTESEARPWILLDLGSEKVVSRFVVHNCYDRYPYPAIRPAFDLSRDAQVAMERFDCRQENEIPLTIELSRDGREFTEVARQDQLFELWIQPIAPRSARFVRVQLLRTEHLQLREIEVY